MIAGPAPDLLARAVAIAAEAHAGQLDKAGQPYILHPLRVMLRVTGADAQMAAALHDVVEDGPGMTLDRLRAEGFPARVVEAVEALTKRPEEMGSDEGYFAFVRRASAHPVARAVKRADLEDNLDLTRLQAPTSRDVARMERYRRALAMLEESGAAGPMRG